jgi:hypothetical protein
VPHPVQPHLDRPFRYPQPAGDRLLSEVLVVAEAQQLPVALVEAFEGGVEVGALHGRDDPLVVGALLGLDRRDRIGADAGVLAEGLVADDRRQPLLAAGAIAQRRAPAPGTEERVLGYVLGFARVVRVAIRRAQADAVGLGPLPAIIQTSTLSDRNADWSTLLSQKTVG